MTEQGHPLLAGAVDPASINVAPSAGETCHTYSSCALSSWAQAGLVFAQGDQSVVQARARSLDDQAAGRCSLAPKWPASCCKHILQSRKKIQLIIGSTLQTT